MGSYNFDSIVYSKQFKSGGLEGCLNSRADERLDGSSGHLVFNRFHEH